MENLPIEVKKENIFKKIKNFISRIFKKEKTYENVVVYQRQESKTNEWIYKVQTEGATDVSSDKNEKMESIIDIIEKNPYLLEKLDTKRLKIIDNYYAKEIEKCRRKLSKVSNN